MKRIVSLYESCKTSIRVSYIGFILLAIGFIIQNENVNLFYTFKSSIILFIGELSLNVGELIVMNLPLIFMLNIVCKKANSSSPVVLALVGYFTYLVTTMLFASQNLGTYAYSSGYGINSVFNALSSSRLPLETGLLGSLIVAYLTRFSFILSRNRSSTSILGFFNKDTAGFIYNVVLCFLAGVAVSYGYPFIYRYIQKAITYISGDLMDPLRIGLYGVLDRILSILGLSNIIRYPFWYTTAGGSFVNGVTGQTVLGDVNIWSIIKNSNTSFMGAGRFITPYYIINMFLIPAYYIGTLICMSDKYERNHFTVVYIFAIGLSIIAGNPLPAELLMLFTSPFLLICYLFVVGLVFALLVKLSVFLGFSCNIVNTNVAMPGSFPDFIINIRNVKLSCNLGYICLIGLAALVIFIGIVIVYYKAFAYTSIDTVKSKQLITEIVAAVGSKDNIDYIGSGLFRLNIYLKDLELVSVEMLQNIGAKRVTETRTGISIEFGTASHNISKKIKEFISV